MDVREHRVIEGLASRAQFYVIFCGFTRMPYVVCDPETKNDEILLYYEEKDALEKVAELEKEGMMTISSKIEQASFLTFFADLYPMGVNAVRLAVTKEEVWHVRVDEIVRRDNQTEMEGENRRIENPAFHISALYFQQAVGQNKDQPPTQEMLDLNEEVMAHFYEGQYLIATREDKQLPMVRLKDGRVFQPLFTDRREYQKFDQELKFKTYVLEAGDIEKILSEPAIGVVVNPMGVSLFIKMKEEADQK